MRIGIYRSCGIGDAVQLTPLFQQIRADFPGAHLSFFTSGNVLEVLSGCPWINETMLLETRVVAGAMARWGGLPVWRRIARRGIWDVFLNLDPQWRRSLFFPLVKAARKGGLQGPGWKPLRLFDAFLEQHPQGLDRGHASERYLELWHKLTGHRDRGFGYSLGHILEPACVLPALPARFVCLAPGAGNAIIPGEIKRWPLENWHRLADQLIRAGLDPVWLGSQDDARHFPIGGAGQNLMGHLNLRETCQLIARSSGLVGNDSGLYHVALGMNIPAAGLFGPTNPQRTGPFRTRNSLVLKAGLGKVAPEQLTDHSPGAIRDALDAVVPMEQLGFDAAAGEILRFLTSRLSA